jgi:hypothetical protein
MMPTDAEPMVSSGAAEIVLLIVGGVFTVCLITFFAVLMYRAVKSESNS